MLGAFYRRIQYLSIDIVIGAVILLRFFCSYFSVYPSWHIQFLLGASVWIIYTIDHLRDSSKAKNSNRARYQFHLKHSKVLKISLLIVVVGSIYSLFHLSSIVLIAGSFLAMLSGIYLVVQSLLAKWGLKELYVAIIYTSGILLVPFLSVEKVDIILFSQLFILTYLNLITFSWFEKKDDEEDGFLSIATVVGESNLEKILLVVVSVGISLTILTNFDRLFFYFIIAFVGFALLLLNTSWAFKNARYRTLGDGVFLLPILFEWV